MGYLYSPALVGFSLNPSSTQMVEKCSCNEWFDMRPKGNRCQGTENSVSQIYASVRIEAAGLVVRPGKQVVIALYTICSTHAPSKQDAAIGICNLHPLNGR